MKSNTHLSRKKKVTHLKWYPSLKLRMVHIYYTGAATRQPWGKSFLCQLIPLFHSHSDLNFSSGYHNFCSGLTVADGGWSNTLRSSSVGKQTNMQEEQLQGGVHYHRLNIGGVHCHTLAHISSAYSIVSWTRMEWVCRSWRLGEMLLATSLPAGGALNGLFVKDDLININNQDALPPTAILL